MKKNEYTSPKMKVVALKRRANLLEDSIIGEVGYNASEEMAPKA